MSQAIIIGVALLGLLLAAAIYVSRAMRKSDSESSKSDGSGAEAPGAEGPDGGGGGGADGD